MKNYLFYPTCPWTIFAITNKLATMCYLKSREINSINGRAGLLFCFGGTTVEKVTLFALFPDNAVKLCLIVAATLPIGLCFENIQGRLIEILS